MDYNKYNGVDIKPFWISSKDPLKRQNEAGVVGRLAKVKVSLVEDFRPTLVPAPLFLNVLEHWIFRLNNITYDGGIRVITFVLDIDIAYTLDVEFFSWPKTS